MTQKDQNNILGMVEELTVWENRVAQWKGELIDILSKENAPKKRQTNKDLIQDTYDSFLKRAARKEARV